MDIKEKYYFRKIGDYGVIKIIDTDNNQWKKAKIIVYTPNGDIEIKGKNADRPFLSKMFIDIQNDIKQTDGWTLIEEKSLSPNEQLDINSALTREAAVHVFDLPGDNELITD